jgi:hypothetical protein
VLRGGKVEGLNVEKYKTLGKGSTPFTYYAKQLFLFRTKGTKRIEFEKTKYF